MMNKGKILALIAAIFLLIASNVTSQCNVSAFTTSDTITCGSSATLSAFGSATGNIAFEEDFNGGSPSGWQFTQTTTIGNNTCGQTSPDGSDFMWMGSASANPREMTTVAFDLTLGGTICFDMVYAVQGDPSPCEGPDEPDEGVYLQYSIDGGLTWINVNYFDPNGGNDPNLTTFNTYCFPIPAGAQTTSTMIQWHQDDVSGAAYDHWGIDNVVITLNDPNFNITWLHDSYSYGLGSPGGNNPMDVSPTTTTTYTVEMTDGTSTCNATIEVVVVDPVIFVNAGNDTTICPGDCINLLGETYEIVSPAKTPTFANNQAGVVTGTPYLPLAAPCVDFSGCVCWDGSNVAFGSSCPPEPGEISAEMNINVQGMNQTSVGNGFITSVCVSDFTITPGIGCTATSLADVEIALICPDGTEVILATTGSLSGGAITNMCFDLGAGSYAGATSPYTGSYAPVNSWSALNGCTSNGVWTLEIRGINLETCVPLGSIDGWSISFDDPAITNPVNYNWSPTSNMTNSNTLTPNICPTATTSYTLTSSDLNGCTSITDDITVTIGSCCPLLLDSLVVVEPTCGLSNGIITVYSSGSVAGLVHSIDGGTTTQSSNVFTGLSDGNYAIYINDNGACPVTGTTILNPSTAPVINSVTVLDPGCGATDGSITINVAGGAAPLQYSIDNGGVFQAANVFSALGGGNYDIVVEDLNGCQDVDAVVLNATPGLTFDAINLTDASCGATDGIIEIMDTGATPTFEYSIDNGVNLLPTNTFTALAAGNYIVVMTDGAGCSIDSLVILSNPNAPIIDSVVVTDASCGVNDGTLTIYATQGNPPLMYSIDNGLTVAATNSFTGLSPASYDVYVGDQSACIASVVAAVNQPNAPIIDSISGVDPSCGNADGELTVHVSGGTPTFNYSIDNGATFVASSTFTNLSDGSFDIVVNDNAGCSASSTFALLGAGNLVFDAIGLTNETCVGGDGSINVISAGAASFSIDNGITTQPLGLFQNLNAGSFTLLIDNGAGCTVDSIVTLIGGAGPTLDSIVVSDVSCFGLSDGSIDIFLSSPLISICSIDGGLTFQPITTFSGALGGAYSIVVEDVNGCQSTGAAVILEPSQLTQNMNVTDVTCFGACDGDAIILANGGTSANGYSYTWSSGIAGVSDAQASAICSGTYIVTVTDDEGCTVDSTFTITEPAQIIINTINAIDETCPGYCDGELEIIGTNIDQYSMDGVTFQSGNTFSNLCPADYLVTVNDANGCIQVQNSTIVNAPTIIADFDVSPTSASQLEAVFETTNYSTNAVLYSWDTDFELSSTEENPVFNVDPSIDAGTYQICLTTTNSNLCEDSTCIEVVINQDNFLYVPNAFTPNGDGDNDFFSPQGLGLDQSEMTFLIFNRWGELIYEFTNNTDSWDGTHQSTPVPLGAYVWKMRVKWEGQYQYHDYIGHVNVIR